MNHYLRQITWRKSVLALLIALLIMPAGLLHAERDEGGGAAAHSHHKARSYRLDLVHSPAVLKLLQLDEQSLRQQLKQDKSLAEIAAERGVSLDRLTEEVAKERSKRLDRAVADGKLSADDAKEMKARQISGIQKRLQAKWSERKMHRRARLAQLADTLKMTPDELNRQLESGKSLAEVAEEKKVPTEQLKTTMRTSLVEMIDQKANDGLIPPSKAAEWKQNVELHLERMLNAKRSSHKHTG
ncbi:hypothetical protein LOK74_18365 [Brevibacillus humidisoli]|uniref:hypothetical protein n=1 Tax=Brevibacillus humidisoli TaxID=2895522 RepID=UPI001E53B660|nr:hypothetical protein [Brevibacillus humidisoli]UFJ39984.1 hypothetical protein LOK74_18365 [Brevibacillus humidisoli]